MWYVTYHRLWFTICIFVCACLFLGCRQSVSHTQPAKPPNIVIILLDDMGFSDLGFLGGEIPTPNIDRLANEGTTYSQFYVYPRCSPTRAALLTGQYPHEVGMGFLALPDDIDAPKGPYQGFLDPEVSTLADDFKSEGYNTYMSGKWHLGEAKEHWPLNYGFDRYFGLISGASSFYELLPQPGGRVRKMAMDDQPWFPPRQNYYMTDAFTDQALSYVSSHFEKREKSPFFLYLAYTAPHFPLHAKEADILALNDLYDAGWTQAANSRTDRLKELGIVDMNLISANSSELKLPSKVDEDTWKQNMQVYAAMMKSADDGIGRLLSELKHHSALDNTIILLFSDNGASAEDVSSRGLHNEDTGVGQKGSYLAYGPQGAELSNMPFRDFKGTTYEGGIRSPLIVFGENPTDPGKINNETVINVTDIRTVLKKKIVKKNHKLSLFEDELREDPIFWEHLGWRGARVENWKAVSQPGQINWELYNILEDPSETRNIAELNPEVLAKIERDWAAWSKETGATPLPLKTLMEWYQPKR